MMVMMGVVVAVLMNSYADDECGYGGREDSDDDDDTDDDCDADEGGDCGDVVCDAEDDG